MILIQKSSSPKALAALKQKAEAQGLSDQEGYALLVNPLKSDDINIKLNLNCSAEAVSLPQSRKAVLDTVQAAVYGQDGDLLQNCINQLQLWENEEDPKTPYIGIAIWWLKGMIHDLTLIEKKDGRQQNG
jgi:hypothetical protein